MAASSEDQRDIRSAVRDEDYSREARAGDTSFGGRMEKSWYILLPKTGEHHIFAQNLGNERLQVLVDGEVAAPRFGLGQKTREGSGALSSSFSFEGPAGSILEVFREGVATSVANWHLQVDGLRVEEYIAPRRQQSNQWSQVSGILQAARGATKRDDGVRDLRSMPEGSYTIAASFDVKSSGLEPIRKFGFKTGDDVHSLEVSHGQAIWHASVDGCIVERKGHKCSDDDGFMEFEISVPFEGGGEVRLPVRIDMSWSPTEVVWRYEAIVNMVPVPLTFMKNVGEIPNVEAPQVLWGNEEVRLWQAGAACASAPRGSMIRNAMQQQQQQQQEAAAASQDAAELATHQDPRPVEAESRDSRNPVAFIEEELLPKGVSRDSASGLYHANIRNKAGRYSFLGAFPTVHEAETKYREAVAAQA